jgi:hypothetical protein
MKAEAAPQNGDEMTSTGPTTVSPSSRPLASAAQAIEHLSFSSAFVVPKTENQVPGSRLCRLRRISTLGQRGKMLK